MRQQLRGYKAEKKVYLGVSEHRRMNITALDHLWNVPTKLQLHTTLSTEDIKVGKTRYHGLC